ncbi:MAG: glutamate-5-semialdehyde dehydrogenase [Clostridiaceae bacterium]|nr:glutamate-5-semialdehyde dehydrogenase [Clostridiaceae bacterium]
MSVEIMARNAKKAAIALSGMNSDKKNEALSLIVKKLYENKEAIFDANKKDIERSKKEELADPLINRLKFDEKKLEDLLDGIKSLIDMKDPIGKTLLSTELDNDLELYKVSCPIGIIGIIFESRPDALVQISALCLKSGNAVLLKGGREASLTNRVLYETILAATNEAKIPENWINLLESRDEVSELLKQDKYVDLIIPRGSNEFVRYIMDNSKIPVMGHADGICHCYIDEDADIERAVSIAVDSKTQYVSVCNALETLLVHEKIADQILPLLKEEFDKRDVELKGCEKTREIIPSKSATEEDWSTEYLDYVLSIKVVDSIDEAIDHINTYGSGHTDVIVSSCNENIEKFMNYVDSGNVFANCSTRFSDGFRYGFGAEVGISTNKLHARGPVGLEGLVTYKYKLIGKGHIVADYAEKRKKFTHRSINKEFGI